MNILNNKIVFETNQYMCFCHASSIFVVQNDLCDFIFARVRIILRRTNQYFLVVRRRTFAIQYVSHGLNRSFAAVGICIKFCLQIVQFASHLNDNVFNVFLVRIAVDHIALARVIELNGKSDRQKNLASIRAIQGENYHVAMIAAAAGENAFYVN